jgi:hypothetical protein
VIVTQRSLGNYEGAYRVAAVSGLITGVAKDATVFSMRWNPATTPYSEGMVKLCAIQRLRAKWRTVSGFTAAQEVGLAAFVARSFSANDSGGTAVTLTGPNQEKRVGVAAPTGVNGRGMPASQMTNMQIANTGAMTAGTRTLDAQPFAQDVFAELAAAATVPKGRFDVEFGNTDQPGFPIILSANEGVVITNTVAMGAGGTARLIVEVDWLELARY